MRIATSLTSPPGRIGRQFHQMVNFAGQYLIGTARQSQNRLFLHAMLMKQDGGCLPVPGHCLGTKTWSANSRCFFLSKDGALTALYASGEGSLPRVETLLADADGPTVSPLGS